MSLRPHSFRSLRIFTYLCSGNKEKIQIKKISTEQGNSAINTNEIYDVVNIIKLILKPILYQIRKEYISSSIQTTKAT